MTGLESLQRGPERPLCEAGKMKPKLQERLQDTRNARKCLLLFCETGSLTELELTKKLGVSEMCLSPLLQPWDYKHTLLTQIFLTLVLEINLRSPSISQTCGQQIWSVLISTLLHATASAGWLTLSVLIKGMDILASEELIEKWTTNLFMCRTWTYKCCLFSKTW